MVGTGDFDGCMRKASQVFSEEGGHDTPHYTEGTPFVGDSDASEIPKRTGKSPRTRQACEDSLVLAGLSSKWRLLTGETMMSRAIKSCPKRNWTHRDPPFAPEPKPWANCHTAQF